MKKLLLIAASLILLLQTSFAQNKKDGTPDMRYKANKQAAAKPAEGPKKKDGTPDMRHKANKDAAAANAAKPATTAKPADAAKPATADAKKKDTKTTTTKDATKTKK